MSKLILFAAFFWTFTSHAQGGSGTHGGDLVAFEFFQTGESLLQQIELLSPLELLSISSTFDPTLLKEALNQTRVASTEADLIFEGEQVDALNHTDENPYRIEVQRKRFFDSSEKRDALTLHEYLGIVEKLKTGAGEWNHYRLSQKILAALRLKSNVAESLGKQWNEHFTTAWAIAEQRFPENTQNYYCSIHSALNSRIAPVTDANPHILSSPMTGIQIHSQTGLHFYREQRLSKDGDVLWADFDEDSRAPVSYAFCQKVLGQGIDRIDLLEENFIEYLNLFSGEPFKVYAAKLRKEFLSKSFVRCFEQSNEDECLKVLKKLSEIHFDEESVVLKSAERKRADFVAWVKHENVSSAVVSFYEDVLHEFMAIQNKLGLQLDLNNQTKASAQMIKEYKDELDELDKVVAPNLIQFQLHYDQMKHNLINQAEIK